MELPDLIGPYKLLDRIGSGAMGEVFLARAEDGTMLAVKKLRQDLVADDALRARLRREVETLAGVHSPHVAELVTADIEADEPYIAVRYIEGRPLSDQSTPATPQDLWHIARGLAQAVHDIATAGYLHRDLKPANVMITPGPPPSPVVIDFGISHALDATRFSRHGRTSGTPGYMAPELAYGVTPGTPTDIYAWGATVAFAATARRAHWSQLGPTEISRILYEITTLPPAFRDLIEDTLNRDPTLRPTPATLVTRITALEPHRGKDIFRRLELDAPTAATGTTTEVVLPGGRFVPVQVPAGSTQGTRLHLPSQGHTGKNAGPPGDLHIELDVHPASDYKRSTNPGHRGHEHSGDAPAEDFFAAAGESSEPAVRPERSLRPAVSPTDLHADGTSHTDRGIRQDLPSRRATSARRKSLVMFGGTLIVASVVSYALWPHSQSERKLGQSPATSPSSSIASASPSGSPSAFEKLPDSCQLLPMATINRLVSSTVVQETRTAQVRTCNVESAAARPYRSLVIQARLVGGANYGDPVEGGRWRYGLDLGLAKDNKMTTRFEQFTGAGDEAFRRCAKDASGLVATCAAEARAANVTLNITFSRQTDPGDRRVQDEMLAEVSDALMWAIHALTSAA